MSATACPVSTPGKPRALPLSYGLIGQADGIRTRDHVVRSEETGMFTTAGRKGPREQATTETVLAHPFLLYPLSYGLAAGGI